VRIDVGIEVGIDVGIMVCIGVCNKSGLSSGWVQTEQECLQNVSVTCFCDISLSYLLAALADISAEHISGQDIEALWMESGGGNAVQNTDGPGSSGKPKSTSNNCFLKLGRSFT